MKKIIQILIVITSLIPNFAAADSLDPNQINLVFSEGKIINKMIVEDFMGTYYHIMHNNKFHLCIAWSKTNAKQPEINCYSLEE